MTNPSQSKSVSACGIASNRASPSEVSEEDDDFSIDPAYPTSLLGVTVWRKGAMKTRHGDDIYVVVSCSGSLDEGLIYECHIGTGEKNKEGQKGVLLCASVVDSIVRGRDDPDKTFEEGVRIASVDLAAPSQYNQKLARNGTAATDVATWIKILYKDSELRRPTKTPIFFGLEGTFVPRFEPANEPLNKDGHRRISAAKPDATINSHWTKLTGRQDLGEYSNPGASKWRCGEFTKTMHEADRAAMSLNQKTNAALLQRRGKRKGKLQAVGGTGSGPTKKSKESHPPSSSSHGDQGFEITSLTRSSQQSSRPSIGNHEGPASKPGEITGWAHSGVDQFPQGTHVESRHLSAYQSTPCQPFISPDISQAQAYRATGPPDLRLSTANQQAYSHAFQPSNFGLLEGGANHDPSGRPYIFPHSAQYQQYSNPITGASELDRYAQPSNSNFPLNTGFFHDFAPSIPPQTGLPDNMLQQQDNTTAPQHNSFAYGSAFSGFQTDSTNNFAGNWPGGEYPLQDTGRRQVDGLDLSNIGNVSYSGHFGGDFPPQTGDTAPVEDWWNPGWWPKPQ